MDRLKSNHYIKLGENWFNLEDLYDSVILKNNLMNPISNTNFTKKDIYSIKENYTNFINIDNETKVLNNKLDDYIEIFDTQITELYSKQEDLYSLIHDQQHKLDKLTK